MAIYCLSAEGDFARVTQREGGFGLFFDRMQTKVIIYLDYVCINDYSEPINSINTRKHVTTKENSRRKRVINVDITRQ